MEKRSRRRVRDLVALPAFQGLSQNEIGCARISMMARSTNAPFKGRIQKRKTNHLQIITFGLQRTAGPYKRTAGPYKVPSADFELLRSSAFQLARYPPVAQRSARSLRLARPRAQLYRAEPYYRPEKCCSAWSLNDPLIADGSIDLVNRLTISNRTVG
jgi:hypothetical protein